MPSREAALAALNDCLDRVMSPSTRLLGPDIRELYLIRDDARQAVAVLEDIADTDRDLLVAHALGWYHWLRSRYSTWGPPEADRAAAVAYLTPVYRVSPQSVPSQLHGTLQREDLDSPSQEEPTKVSRDARGLDVLTPIAYERMDERVAFQQILPQILALFPPELQTLPADDPDRVGILTKVGRDLQALYEQTGHVQALKAVMQVSHRAAAQAQDLEDRAGLLSNVGVELQSLYERIGRVEVLEEAVTVGREAVAIMPRDHHSGATILANLGRSCSLLFERTGRVEVLEEAVAVRRDAVAATPRNHPDRAVRLNLLGAALWAQFGRTARRDALDEAVAVLREAAAAMPHDDPDRASCLANLGGALHELFRCTARRDALDEAVHVLREAVAAAPRTPLSRADCLNRLGIALKDRFLRTGEGDALDEAVQLFQEAVAATPHEPAFLTNLGMALMYDFERTLRVQALQEAVAVSRQAVTATRRGDPKLAARLSNLGLALLALPRSVGQADPVREAVTLCRQALTATPHDHPDHAERLNNVGIALAALFEHTGEASNLSEAVRLLREAVAATPDNHPDRAGRLRNLGWTVVGNLIENDPRPRSLDEARRCFREAADNVTSETFTRISAYRDFALVHAVKAMNAGPDAALAGLKAIEDAIDLLPLLAPRRLTRADRQHQLGRRPGLAQEAAAAALAAGSPARAVELLERSRGILAADLLDLRNSDIYHLRELAPELADELEGLRARLIALDRPQPALSPSAGTTETPQAVQESHQRLAQDRIAAHDAWERLLARIRALPECSDFLRAPSVKELARHTHAGPVVFVTASLTRCDAVILSDRRDNPVDVVPLPQLTHEAAAERADLLRAALHNTGNTDLAPRARARAQQEILAVLAWLWDTVADPVLAHLSHTSAPPPGTAWPRLWWCPVGILADLPLHAAGHHNNDPEQEHGRRTVLDRVITSYTFTVRGLARPRQHRPESGESHTLIIPAPEAAGHLPGVRTETTALAGLVPDARVLDAPTRDAVLNLLPRSRVAHFACHGRADHTAPDTSHLVLTDHADAPLTVADITALDLTADLAFLSACDTSVTAPRLVDESLHITGAFHLAGYRHVIGTLWRVDDRIAAKLAADFYTHLTNNGTVPPQADRSAHALHQATRHLRDLYPNTPSLWAAYTHTGHPPRSEPPRQVPSTTGWDELRPTEERIVDDGVPGDGAGQKLRQLQAAERLDEQLLNSVPCDDVGRRLWHLATPYLLRHAAQHALDAGHLDDLLQDSGFLVHADPHALADALPHAGSEQARLNAAVYRASWGVHHTLPPAARRQLLALDAARYRNQRLQADLPGDNDWQVQWATESRLPAELDTLTGHTDMVASVAVTEVGGRPHTLTGSNGGAVRLWDLTTGALIRQLTGHTGVVDSVAVTEVGGRPHALTASWDRSVRVWDLTSGEEIRQLTGHTKAVTSLAVTEVGGRAHALTASWDGSVRVWDLTSGEEIRQLTGHTKAVTSLAVTEVGGRAHALTASWDGSVRVWDLTTGEQIRQLTGHTDIVDSVAVTEVGGRRHALTASWDGSVRVWDLTSGEEIRQLTGHTKAVTSLAVTELDGRPHALTASWDRSVRVWDLTTGSCLTTYHLPAEPMAATVTADGTVILGVDHDVVALSLAPLARRPR
ncbi:CHAT domain-containing protein [Streptomyces sp. 2A115]|uniref:CHAT domain-containing protein n=1 Tax=Streptomyces sp. 2A115 TaxID=3457439 RepID=UPI003FD65B63